DGGETWEPSSKGLGSRDVFCLHQSIENPAAIYAGTNAGVYRSDDKGAIWAYVGKETILPTPTKKPTRSRRGRRAELITPANNHSVTVASAPAVGRYQTVAVQKSSTRKNSKAESKPKAATAQKSKRPVKKPVEEPLQPTGIPTFDLAKQVDGVAEIID